MNDIIAAIISKLNINRVCFSLMIVLILVFVPNINILSLYILPFEGFEQWGIFVLAWLIVYFVLMFLYFLQSKLIEHKKSIKMQVKELEKQKEKQNNIIMLVNSQNEFTKEIYRQAIKNNNKIQSITLSEENINEERSLKDMAYIGNIKIIPYSKKEIIEPGVVKMYKNYSYDVVLDDVFFKSLLALYKKGEILKG